MSSFLGAGWGLASAFSVLQAASEATSPDYYQWNGWGRKPLAPWLEGVLWSATKFIGSDANGCLFGMDAQSTGRWSAIAAYEESGGQQCKKLIGTCRDSTGAVLGSCVIQGFLSGSDLFAGQMTCDAAGYFEFCTPYTGAHYLVAYKAGSPDVAGTTVNTLVPV